MTKLSIETIKMEKVYVSNEYQELLNELEEEEAQLERTIERKLK